MASYDPRSPDPRVEMRITSCVTCSGSGKTRCASCRGAGQHVGRIGREPVLAQDLAQRTMMVTEESAERLLRDAEDGLSARRALRAARCEAQGAQAHRLRDARVYDDRLAAARLFGLVGGGALATMAWLTAVIL